MELIKDCELLVCDDNNLLICSAGVSNSQLEFEHKINQLSWEVGVLYTDNTEPAVSRKAIKILKIKSVFSYKFSADIELYDVQTTRREIESGLIIEINYL